MERDARLIRLFKNNQKPSWNRNTFLWIIIKLIVSPLFYICFWTGLLKSQGAKLAEMDAKSLRNIIVMSCSIILTLILGAIYSVSIQKVWKAFKLFRSNFTLVARNAPQNPTINVSVWAIDLSNPKKDIQIHWLTHTQTNTQTDTVVLSLYQLLAIQLRIHPCFSIYTKSYNHS